MPFIHTHLSLSLSLQESCIQLVICTCDGHNAPFTPFLLPESDERKSRATLGLSKVSSWPCCSSHFALVSQTTTGGEKTCLSHSPISFSFLSSFCLFFFKSFKRLFLSFLSLCILFFFVSHSATLLSLSRAFSRKWKVV